MPLKILVVEDEDTNMRILTIGLQHVGHQVIGAYNPELGLLIAQQELPDVVLMDLMFKGATMDGIEAIRRLKANPVTAAIPVVAQTASVLEFNELMARGAGADGFIRKPFRRREVLEAIEAAVGASPREVCASQASAGRAG